MRLLLDTNVWQYVVSCDQVNALRRAAKENGWDVTVAPSVVYEVLRTGDPARRGSTMEAITRQSWRRLMPEVFLQSLDVVASLRRRRPDWVRPAPDYASFHRERSDWIGSGGFWGRARTTSATTADVLRALEGDWFDVARADAARRRQEFAAIPFDKLALTGWTIDVPGRRGPRKVEPWRVETSDTWWRALNGGAQRAYLDWCEPFLALDVIRAERDSWEQLWFDEVDVTEVPREWLRWGTHWLQGTRKVTPGTPGDNQLAAYLVDAHAFLTADRTFVEIVERLRADAEFTIAQPVRVAHAQDMVNEIERALAASPKVENTS